MKSCIYREKEQFLACPCPAGGVQSLAEYFHEEWNKRSGDKGVKYQA